MKRGLLNLLAALSLLLCVAAVVLCVRSSHVIDTRSFSPGRSRGHAFVYSHTGSLLVGYCRVVEGDPARGTVVPPGATPRAWSSPRLRPGPWRRIGVGWGEMDFLFPAPGGDLPIVGRMFSVARTGRCLLGPWWAVAAAASFASGIRLFALARAWRRRAALRSGHCSRCGYDLRATPDRCPECGTRASVSRTDNGDIATSLSS